MKVTKTIHKSAMRIKIEFPYNQSIAAKIKTIPGARWSKTMTAWHIPYAKYEFNLLKRMFPELDFPGKEKTPIIQPSETIEKPKTTKPLSNGVQIIVTARKISIKLPKNDTDTHFITSFKYSRWEHLHFCWIIPNYPGNLDLLKDYFKDRITDFQVNDTYEVAIHPHKQIKVKNNELVIIKTNSKRLKLIFGFHKELTYLIKTIPYFSWDSLNKWWTIPYANKYLKKITDLAIRLNIKTHFEEELPTDGGKPRITSNDVVNYRTCPDEYLLKLKELRYSENTIKSYPKFFEEFINYYNKYDIDKIDDKMIVTFLRYLVIDRKVSTSYQNISINALKFYYERVLYGQRKVYLVERPRKEKILPEILSIEEITTVVKTFKNIKHKALFLIIYSSGLRLSESINLRLTDIDRDRMKVYIQQSKGRKDRYTILSKKLLPILDEYYDEYNPQHWVFEGAKGNQYSASSVQSVVTAAYAKAGIMKKVSTHSLRHTFGTHLLESGVDLRYIQILMGHESSKTTEIYTHITNKGFNQIQNPLDKLDF